MIDTNFDINRVYWYYWGDVFHGEWVPVMAISYPYTVGSKEPAIYVEFIERRERQIVPASCIYDSIRGVQLFPNDYPGITTE